MERHKMVAFYAENARNNMQGKGIAKYLALIFG
jgi:hypothetical protein